MRRVTAKLCAIPVAVMLSASAPAGARTSAGREPVAAIQPTDSPSKLLLLSRPGWTRVQSESGRQRLALGPDETMTTIAETASGWVAGGVRASAAGSSVFLMSSAARTGARLPALEQSDALQLRPVLLVDDGRLTGAAWLEGDSERALAVRFAEWTGVDWGPVQRVARPGPGSQTGLTGAVLRGGATLLAWSRFDGTDDEIYWSWRAGAAWSAPARVGADNGTPDITPVLAAADRGATLVWGRMDGGEYRLLARTFQAGEWQGERVVSAPASAFPTLVRSRNSLMALYRTGRPRGWSVAVLDGDTPVTRRAQLEEDSAVRPVVTGLGATGPVLRWLRPGRSAQLRWDAER